MLFIDSFPDTGMRKCALLMILTTQGKTWTVPIRMQNLVDSQKSTYCASCCNYVSYVYTIAWSTPPNPGSLACACTIVKLGEAKHMYAYEYFAAMQAAEQQTTDLHYE